MIGNLTSKVTGGEGGFAKILAALGDPSSLAGVLQEQTGLDQAAIASTTDTIKQALG